MFDSVYDLLSCLCHSRLNMHTLRQHPQMCFKLVHKAKLCEFTQHITLHSTVASVEV